MTWFDNVNNALSTAQTWVQTQFSAPSGDSVDLDTLESDQPQNNAPNESANTQESRGFTFEPVLSFVPLEIASLFTPKPASLLNDDENEAQEFRRAEQLQEQTAQFEQTLAAIAEKTQQFSKAASTLAFKAPLIGQGLQAAWGERITEVGGWKVAWERSPVNEPSYIGNKELKKQGRLYVGTTIPQEDELAQKIHWLQGPEYAKAITNGNGELIQNLDAAKKEARRLIASGEIPAHALWDLKVPAQNVARAPAPFKVAFLPDSELHNSCLAIDRDLNNQQQITSPQLARLQGQGSYPKLLAKNMGSKPPVLDEVLTKISGWAIAPERWPVNEPSYIGDVNRKQQGRLYVGTTVPVDGALAQRIYWLQGPKEAVAMTDDNGELIQKLELAEARARQLLARGEIPTGALWNLNAPTKTAAATPWGTLPTSSSLTNAPAPTASKPEQPTEQTKGNAGSRHDERKKIKNLGDLAKVVSVPFAGLQGEFGPQVKGAIRSTWGVNLFVNDKSETRFVNTDRAEGTSITIPGISGLKFNPVLQRNIIPEFIDGKLGLRYATRLGFQSTLRPFDPEGPLAGVSFDIFLRYKFAGGRTGEDGPPLTDQYELMVRVKGPLNTINKVAKRMGWELNETIAAGLEGASLFGITAMAGKVLLLKKINDQWVIEDESSGYELFTFGEFLATIQNLESDVQNLRPANLSNTQKIGYEFAQTRLEVGDSIWRVLYDNGLKNYGHPLLGIGKNIIELHNHQNANANNEAPTELKTESEAGKVLFTAWLHNKQGRLREKDAQRLDQVLRSLVQYQLLPVLALGYPGISQTARALEPQASLKQPADPRITPAFAKMVFQNQVGKFYEPPDSLAEAAKQVDTAYSGVSSSVAFVLSTIGTFGGPPGIKASALGFSVLKAADQGWRMGSNGIEIPGGPKIEPRKLMNRIYIEGKWFDVDAAEAKEVSQAEQEAKKKIYISQRDQLQKNLRVKNLNLLMSIQKEGGTLGFLGLAFPNGVSAEEEAELNLKATALLPVFLPEHGDANQQLQIVRAFNDQEKFDVRQTVLRNPTFALLLKVPGQKLYPQKTIMSEAEQDYYLSPQNRSHLKQWIDSNP